jgi:NAD(P)-dependent dehydrogenase (short-subunit alcohol dehydrogenase family)
MGQACARALGQHYDLVLTDITPERLEQFAVQLDTEGHTVVIAHSGDIADHDVVDALVRKARQAGELKVVVHTAGLSPTLASWDLILAANVSGTANLLRALEAEQKADGLVAVLITSMAAHMAPADQELDALLDAPTTPDLIAAAEPLLRRHADPDDPRGLGGAAYGFSKSANKRWCEQRCIPWARLGRRIVSVSPGTMKTPMGLKEAKENPSAKAVVDATPMGRWGTVLDIASAVAFLVSDQASFITGTDLRVDGGVTPAFKQRAAKN